MSKTFKGPFSFYFLINRFKLIIIISKFIEVNAVCSGDTVNIAEGAYNIFQNVMSDTLVDTYKIIDTLKQSGALCSLMSGSGPSVFGIFETKKLAEKACEDLKKSYFAAFCELK